MSDPIQQSMEQVIEIFLSSPPELQAQVALCLYPLHPKLASELHHLAMMHRFAHDPQAAKQPQGFTPKAYKDLDKLLRAHRGTSRL